MMNGHRHDYARGNYMRRGDWGCPNPKCRAGKILIHNFTSFHNDHIVFLMQ